MSTKFFIKMKTIPISFKTIQIIDGETFKEGNKDTYSFEFLSSSNNVHDNRRNAQKSQDRTAESDQLGSTKFQQFQVEENGLISMGWGKGSWFKFLMRRACISVDSALFCRGLDKLLRYFGVKTPPGISRIMWPKA